MRVIAGVAKRIPLKTVEGLDTRPTTDRIKETLFNMIQYEVYDQKFLDLFAGSGAIGIEALSRGSEKAVFIEQGRKQVQCIKENLKATRLEERAVVMEMEVLSAIQSLERKNEQFGLIFMDPPYNKGLEKKVLEKLEQSKIVNEDTLIIVEASLDTSFEFLENTVFAVEQMKKYKTNQHVFIRKKSE